MSKKSYLCVILPLIFLLSGCGKKQGEHENFGPSPGDGKSQAEEPDENFGPSPGDG